MTCEEFRSQIEAGSALTESAPVAHVETCATCRAFSYAHEELGRSLQTIRDGAPGVPESLDAAVMSAFQRETAQRSTAPIWWRNSAPRFVWATVAAMLVVGAVFAIARRNPETVTNPPVVRSVAPITPPVQQPELVAGKIAHPKPKVLRAHTVPRKLSPRAVAASSPPIEIQPESDFQNLMYCDALSCAGEMQMIRIQLPASAINRVPALHPANGLVQADVVVGSDGIARAIRIVK